MNKVYEEQLRKVEDLVKDKHERLEEYKTKKEQEEKLLTQAEKDKKEAMTAGKLKAYQEAEIRRQYHEERATMLAGKITDLDGDKVISAQEQAELVTPVYQEQSKELAAERKEIEQLIRQIAAVIERTSASLRDGNSILQTVDSELYKNTTTNQYGEDIPIGPRFTSNVDMKRFFEDVRNVYKHRTNGIDPFRTSYGTKAKPAEQDDSSVGPITKESIMKVKNTRERQKLIADNMELFTD